ncbi:MAG: hypothetical protein NTW11_00010 [Candidatus Staskawiczbacteria bacterium]|nr:hypothetical protein [Candidatus Staskawiczbacteria bacterium]
MAETARTESSLNPELEKALEMLRKPETRESLGTYVPASFEAMKNTIGQEANDELVVDAVHFMADQTIKDRKMELGDAVFIHELVDMLKTRPTVDEPEKLREFEEQMYQKAREYMIKNSELGEYIPECVGLFLKSCVSDDEKKEWMQKRAPTGQLFRYCVKALANPVASEVGTEEETRGLKKKVHDTPRLPGVIMVRYLDAMKKHKGDLGLRLDFPPADISIISNNLLKYSTIGAFNNLDNFHERIFGEIIDETPELRDKIVEIGKQYGVEIKIPEKKKEAE